MENQADKTNIPFKKKDRIKSFDIFKGIAIFWIVVGHVAFYWLISSDIWLYEVLLTFVFRCITGLGFIFLIGVNLSISFNSKREKGWTYKQFYFYNLKRVGVLLIFSVIYNIIIELLLKKFNFAKIWSWYILQSIAISIILLLLLCKVPNTLKILIGIVIIFISYPLFNFISNMADYGPIIQQILFYPYEQYPILPWFSAPLFGWVVGDFFYKVRYKKVDNTFNGRKKYRNLILGVILVGSVLISLGIIFGNAYPSSSNPYETYWYQLGLYPHINNLHTNPFFLSIPNIPYFLLEGHWTFLIYGVGVVFVCLGLLTYVCDYKKYNNFIFNSLAFTGRFSFSIFLYHHVGILLFVKTFNAIWIWVSVPLYTILFISLIWIIVKKFNAVGTIEWLMVVVTYEARDRKD